MAAAVPPPSREPTNSAPIIAQTLSPKPTASVKEASPDAPPPAASSALRNFAGLSAASFIIGLLRPKPTLAAFNTAAAVATLSVKTLLKVK